MNMILNNSKGIEGLPTLSSVVKWEQEFKAEIESAFKHFATDETMPIEEVMRLVNTEFNITDPARLNRLQECLEYKLRMPLTMEEQKIMSILSLAYREFTNLPEQHVEHKGEFASNLSELQRIITYRAMQRIFPAHFPIVPGAGEVDK